MYELAREPSTRTYPRISVHYQVAPQLESEAYGKENMLTRKVTGVNSNMSKEDMLDLSVTAAQINTGEFNPYDKYVSTDTDLAEHVDYWNIEFVQPNHPVMNRAARVDPFSATDVDWREREQELDCIHEHESRTWLSRTTDW